MRFITTSSQQEMSCRQGLLLLILCGWLLLQVRICPVQGVALNLPRRDVDQQDAEPMESESPTTENVTSPSNCTRNRTSTEGRSFAEKRKALIESIRQHMMAKLNMMEPPRRVASRPLSASQLATYQALVQALQSDHSHDCGDDEETTHFSKHLRLYHPGLFVSTEPSDLHHLGKTKSSD